jgi:alpha-1,2-mannosyltransferase
MSSACAPAISARPPATTSRRETLWLFGGLVVFTVSVAAFVLEARAYGRPFAGWFDFNIYYHAGQLARHDPQALYAWHSASRKGFTYTPFAALAFVPLSLLPIVVARWLMTAASIGALVVAVWATAGAVGLGGRERGGLALALAAGLLWTEPVLKALKLGQVELLLMALVVWDLCRSDERRLTGAGVGLAAGIKLVPLIFIVYLALCGRTRAARRATVVFVMTIAAGFLLLPQPSVTAWIHGRMFDPAGDGGVGSFVNQSLLGFLSRIDGSVHAARLEWIVCATATLVGGLAVAVWLHRSGRPVAGWLICAITGVLVSPISWDHHWVWIAPLIAYGVLLCRSRSGASRVIVAGATAAITLMFVAWPRHVSGTKAFLPGAGLLGIFDRRSHGVPNPMSLNAAALVSWDLFVICGIALVAAAIAAALAHHRAVLRKPQLARIFAAGRWS